MSGDVQPRKRKDKRRKKDGEYTVQRIPGASFDDEDSGTPPPTLLNPSDSAADNLTIHVHKEDGTGGHWCARLVFFALLAILVGLIGVILIEHRGATDVDTPVTESRWATIFDGWVDDAPPSHDDDPQGGPEGDHEEASEEGDEHEEGSEEGGHDDEEGSEEAEGSEAASDEMGNKDSREDDGEEDEGIGSDEEDDTASAEENDGKESQEEDQESDEQVEGFYQGDTDNDNDEGSPLEEVDRTSGEENDSVGKEEDEIINGSDDEFDASIEGVKASGEERYDDDTSGEFLGIPGVNEIDDNSAEPLEEVEDEEPEEIANEVDIEPQPEEIEEESSGGGDNATRSPVSGEEAPDLSRRHTIIPPPHIEQIVPTIIDKEEGQGLKVADEQTQDYEDLRSKYKKLETEGHNQEAVVKKGSDPTAATNPVKGLQVEKITAKDIWAERSPAGEEPKALQRASGKETSEEEEEEEEELETSEGERISGTEEEEEDDEEIEDVDDNELVAKLDAKYGKLPTPPESEGEEESEEEDEEDEEEEEEEDDEDIQGWKRVKAPRDSQSESEDEPKAAPKTITRTKQQEKDLSSARDYVFANISNPDDIVIREKIDSALAKPAEQRIGHFTKLLLHHPTSPRTRYELARAFEDLSHVKRSNEDLLKSIVIYQSVLDLGLNVPSPLYKIAAERCIKCMRFTGQYKFAQEIHTALIDRFPNEAHHRNQLVVTLLIQGKWQLAKKVLEKTLHRWPKNGFALVHMGYVMKTGVKNMLEGAMYLKRGIETGEEDTIDGKFYFHLGDALSRIGKQSEALEVYQKGADYGLFRSAYQRSLYNIDRLTGRPWWTLEQTTYEKFLKNLESNWRLIKAEGLTAMYKTGRFKGEEEDLIQSGVWRQFELFIRSRRVTGNCDQVPRTCELIDRFPPAANCRRGQVKFSVIFPGTHVWAHCGPTNCRLRAHLGLSGSKGAFIRVGNEVRQWEDGKVMVFDDSFEHEVWHNGTEPRLVLIVDFWHPELTETERNGLPEL